MAWMRSSTVCGTGVMSPVTPTEQGDEKGWGAARKGIMANIIPLRQRFAKGIRQIAEVTAEHVSKSDPLAHLHPYPTFLMTQHIEHRFHAIGQYRLTSFRVPERITPVLCAFSGFCCLEKTRGSYDVQVLEGSGPDAPLHLRRTALKNN